MPVKNIVVLLNDIDSVIHSMQQVIKFASKQKKVHLYFIKVIDSFQEIRNALNIKTPRVEKMLLKEVQEKIINFFAEAPKNITLSFHVKEGISFIEVIHEVIRYKADLLIIPESNLTKSQFASNTFHLIRKCPCPVWVTKALKSKEKLRILVAADIDLNDKVRKNVNDKCMSLALLFSKAQHANIDIIHAWSLKNENLLRENSDLNIAYHQIDIMVNREKKYHKEWFSAFLKKQQKIPIKKKHFIKGDADEAIPQIIKKENINLLIMGTIGSLKTPGLLISNRAETILQNISCSVITVKPDGFISPVK